MKQDNLKSKHAPDPLLERLLRVIAALRNPDGGTLSGVTKGLPALLQAIQLQEKAAQTGFEWPDLASCLIKFEEELEELKAAKTPEEIEDELGDVLFCIVNYARMQGINPEEALYKANEKFTRRFEGMEKQCTENNQKLSDLSLDEMLDLWRQQKAV